MFGTTAVSDSKSCSAEGNNCCTPQPKGKALCPECGENAKIVLGKTVEHLLTGKARSDLYDFDGFHYCKTPSCRVVYFRKETILTQKDISVTVGLKEDAEPATVCYCFGWTKEKIKNELQRNGRTIALDDIKAKMKDPGCSCEILNPSGGCCLGDVGKAIKTIENELGASATVQNINIKE